ncbi:MAG TPA: prolipoprotein diacylglyceryl transferase [Candidatus Peribacterales bacterium]|nr:prolipoprotein diacylglyceryl transferase [Candidatus Peribacterales bacterium]
MQLFPTRQIFFEAGPIVVHWYGMMYLAAFLIAWLILPVLARKRGVLLRSEDAGDLLFAGVLGTIIGGRLGYVLFYAPLYFAENPLEILMVWNGGMSSHGGMIGVAIAMLILHTRLKDRVTIWQLGDILVIPIAIGLAFGRLGNFINLELYGPLTNLPWGILIPGKEGLHHPTQIYAMVKDLSIAGICLLSLLRSKNDGMTLGFFFLLYGILRFLLEYIRVETASGFDLGFLYFTRGQVLTIPVITIGLIILWKKSFDHGRLDTSQ